MFNKIQRLIEERTEAAEAAVRNMEEAFGDPVARQTDWTPARPGGTKGRSRRLVQSGSHRLTFRPTVQKLLFYGVAVLAGAGIIMFQPMANTEPAWIPPVNGLAFLLMGLMFGYRASTPVVVDTQVGACWCSWRSPGSADTARNRDDCMALDDVHAIQVIPERLRHKESAVSYEINLVEADGNRLNLVDHSNQAVIREDARALGAFLDVPVWDASGFPPQQLPAVVSASAKGTT